ncbi:MAG: transcriptional repressor LexA [Nitrospirae bacterium]|nr:transcriptional repressor LexA [Nitrospirota bacterium]
MLTLTDKQKKILDFLKEYLQKSGYPPTVREIGERFGILWAAARMHLKAIERKGFIKINPARSRGLEIPGLRRSDGIMAPVAGKIRAGKPILAVEEINSHIFIDKTLFPAEDAFSLKVTGDSMTDAGILDGDFVIVRPQSTIKNGETGVVLIGDEATVKRVFKEKDKITLKPENRNMEPATHKSDEVIIIGKVIGVIRKI